MEEDEEKDNPNTLFARQELPFLTLPSAYESKRQRGGGGVATESRGEGQGRGDGTKLAPLPLLCQLQPKLPESPSNRYYSRK